MPRVIFSSTAVKNLKHLRDFLRLKNPAAAERAAQAIIKAIRLLEQHPKIGRPVKGEAGKMRDLPIAFGRSGYVVRYVFEDKDVEILTIRHMREAGFQIEDYSERI